MVLVGDGWVATIDFDCQPRSKSYKGPYFNILHPTLDDVVGGTGNDISRISLYSIGVLVHNGYC